MPVEAGHQPGRGYFDQAGGDFHPNGGAIDCSDTGQFVVTPVQTITAAGTTQGTATPVTAPTALVNGANATAGVILPVPVLGQEVSVINPGTATNTLKVYPDLGGSINGGGANVAAVIPITKGAAYVCVGVNPSVWWSLSN